MKPTESYESSGEIRGLIEDLFKVRPMIYWADLIAFLAIGWGFFAWIATADFSSWLWKVACLIVCAFVLFRPLIFVHEIVHFRAGDLPGFHWVWNIFCGLPFMLPEYLYLPHYYHHRMATFSTAEDPEYIPLRGQTTWAMLRPFLVFPLIPVVFGIRFLLLGPLSLLIRGRFRDGVLCHLSTLKMNPSYQWNTISTEDRRIAAQQDWMCFFFWAVALAAVIVSRRWDILLNWYILIYAVLSINHLRSFARHRYINVAGKPVSYEDQLLDSVTIDGFSPLASLFMPVGLRWHSIHHMFPTLPYHAMPAAHKRLAAKLPKDHLYFKTLVRDFTTAQLNIFRKSYPLPHNS